MSQTSESERQRQREEARLRREREQEVRTSGDIPCRSHRSARVAISDSLCTIQASQADLLFGDAFDSIDSRPKDFVDQPNSDPSIRRPEPRYG